MYERILVTTDGSTLSRKALKSAIALAASLRAELVVLHVVPRYPTSYLDGALTQSHTEIARVEKHWAEMGQELVDAGVDQAAKAGVKARGAVARSDLVADAIMAAVRKHKADLLVMASHGRKGIKRLLMGSETQHVLTHSPVPVLVLR